MTFSALRSAINSIRLHDLAETNVLGVRATPHGLVIEQDESELNEAREKLKRAQDEAKQADKDADEAIARAEQMEHERDEGRQLLAAINDGTASLADYIKRAEQANGLAQAWREHAERVEKEVTALRKRKGIEAAYFTHAREIIAALHDGPDKWAQDLAAKLHASK